MFHPSNSGQQPSQPGSATSSAPPRASLPARPPPPASSLPAFKAAPGTGSYGKDESKATTAASLPGFTGFKPRSVDWRSHPPAVSAGPAPPSTYSAQQTMYANNGYQQNPYGQQQQAYYPQPETEAYAQPTPPQIRNPFPVPNQDSGGGQGGGRGYGSSNLAYDPEMEAQIQQWQSAYASKDDAGSGNLGGKGRWEGAYSAGGANAIPLGARNTATASITTQEVASAANVDTGVAAVVAGADGKQKTVVRSGGGQTWQDPTLLEWDPSHFRLFVGNLAGEVTDESLLKAFSRYVSVQKARVVRDKRTTKSKGYGFVSFKDGDEYFQAAKEMQGKYIGSHPVQVKRSTTEIRPTVPTDKRKGAKGAKGGGSGVGSGSRTGAGVQKKQSKTKGGLKILG